MEKVQVQNIIPEKFNPILDAIGLLGGGVFLVGGTPRDIMIERILGQSFEPHDWDFEVYGVHPDPLLKLLKTFGNAKLVGEAFGVFTIQGDLYGDNQWSIPRTEKKTGRGHKDFEAQLDPSLDASRAVLRRDFTINTLLINRYGVLHDPQGQGIPDIATRTLRHTSGYFTEDPLRPLRGARFASQKGFNMKTQTANLCASIKDQFQFLPKERIWVEIEKMMLGAHPELGLKVLVETEWIECFPRLDLLRWTKQDSEWHPEGDVFDHTCEAVEKMASLSSYRFNEQERKVLNFAALLHDIGKPETTTTERGHVRSLGHAERGEEIAKEFLRSMIPNQDDDTRRGDNKMFIEEVATLVRHHMDHLTYTELTPRIVRRLARKIHPASIDMLMTLVEADALARGGNADIPEIVGEIRYMATQEDVVEKPVPELLRGQDLIDIYKLKPGKQFKVILDSGKEALDNGDYADRDGALAWLSYYLKETRNADSQEQQS